MIVALVGDSTVTNNAGWGKALAGRFKSGVEVMNFAVGGRSSKSYIDEGRLPAVLQAKPDYVLIQFGHNDQPGKGASRETDPATSFRGNLRRYVTAFREIGARPVLLSSVCRRTFDASGRLQTTLTPWADAARIVAEEMNVPFIDLHAASMALHNKMGPAASMAFNPKPEDTTHFNATGAEAMAGLVAQGIKAVAAELAAYLKQ